MTKKIYYEDSYLKSIDAIILDVDNEKGIRLDATLFFPGSSSEYADKGTLKGVPVTPKKIEDDIWHYPLKNEDICLFSQGEKVFCEIDWNRRFSLLRHHSALHLLAYILGDMGTIPAGGQVQDDNSYLIMREIINENFIPDVIKKANDIICENRIIKTYESIEREGFRYSEIEGFLPLPCGGIHVQSLSNIGKIKLIETKIKKKKTHIYIDVEEVYNGTHS